MRFAVSHACAGPSTHSEVVLCDKAVIRYSVGGTIEIRWTDGRTEKWPLDPFDPLLENHLDYFRYLRGESPRPATTLADSRPFVALNDLAHVSSKTIGIIPADRVSGVRDEKEQKDYLHVGNMIAAHENFLVRGVWPSGCGWGREPGEVVTPGDLPRFHEIVRTMAGK
jgi:hypothetical protein